MIEYNVPLFRTRDVNTLLNTIIDEGQHHVTYDEVVHIANKNKMWWVSNGRGKALVTVTS